MDPNQQLRNLKDFLLVYNRMTEICFQRCTNNFNFRNLTMDEESCLDSCAGKLIRSNHRLMGTYVQLMPRMVQRRMEEMESKAAEAAKAAAAAMPAAVETGNTEATPAFQTPLNSPPLPNLPSSGTGGIPEVQSSDFKSAGLDILADPSVMGATVSSSKLLTPKTEAVLNDVSLPAGSPNTAEPSSPRPTAPTES
ncbi:mitochondrial import inner membrane translocase subunit Tim10 B [Nematolebias whitei]|uniref:mitochondrial import inner membrane translocase subunit Tim10 B n=1 Tax=Nematolebias whitei TaxID=451745 RepID=UPI00189C3887|nr:mitochondrial import inner membrane translocase subunit Tim10 B [Nematolebias whitei]